MIRTPLPRLEPGRLLAGKYRIKRVLGAGAMGVVYASQHEFLKHDVALKLMRGTAREDGTAAARFLDEARNASQIESDHVVRVTDFGLLEDGAPFMVMELLQGQDLAAFTRKRNAPLPVAQIVDWLLEIIDGLAHAHAIGIVHRDLKPSNLFLSRRPDGTDRIKVLDFGISKANKPHASPRVTETGALLGTPLYMPPEQLRSARQVDVRTDIWALGVVAYELLTSQLPFRGGSPVELFTAATQTVPVSLNKLRRDIPDGLDAAVLRCLRQDPADRYDTVGNLGAAVAQYGTDAASRTLVRALRVTYSNRSSLAPRALSAATPITLGEEDGRSGQSSGERSPGGESIVPWSSGDGRATTPGVSDGLAERRALRPSPIRAVVATGSVASLLVGGIAYGLAHIHRANAQRAPPQAEVATALVHSVASSRPAVTEPFSPSNQIGEGTIADAGSPEAVASSPNVAGALAPASGPALTRNAVRVHGDHRATTATAVPHESSDAGLLNAVSMPSLGLSGTSVPQKPPINCNPPYVIDALGHRQYKPECP